MAILSCVYTEFSGDDHGACINLNLRYFHPFRGMCLAIARPIFLELFETPAEIAVRCVIINVQQHKSDGFYGFEISLTFADNLGPMRYMNCLISHPFWGVFLAIARPFSLNCSRRWPWFVVQIQD